MKYCNIRFKNDIFFIFYINNDIKYICNNMSFKFKNDMIFKKINDKKNIL